MQPHGSCHSVPRTDNTMHGNATARTLSTSHQAYNRAPTIIATWQRNEARPGLATQLQQGQAIANNMRAYHQDGMLRHRQGVRLSRHEALPRSPHDREARRHHRDAWVLQCGNSWHNPSTVAPHHTPHGIPSRVAAVVRHEKCGPQREQPQSSHESQQGTELRGKHHCQYQGEVPTHAYTSNVTTATPPHTHARGTESPRTKPRRARLHGEVCYSSHRRLQTVPVLLQQSCRSPESSAPDATHLTRVTANHDETAHLRPVATHRKAGTGREREKPRVELRRL